MGVTGSTLQTPGTYISAIGHTVLIGWLILGWGFDAEPLSFEVTEVSVITGEEYEQLVRASTPKPADAEPTAPVTPRVDETPPSPAIEEPPAPAPLPETVEPPVEETPPPPPPAPLETEVTDAPPVEPVPPAVVAQPAPDLEVSPRPVPRAAPRVAPEPVAPPPPAVQVADVPVEATEPAETPEPDVIEEPVEEQAPEEAATEIVLENEKPSGAVETSRRPTTRPNRPAPTVETPAAPAEPETQSAQSSSATDDAAVQAALEAALAGVEAPAVAEGPPMTGSEQEGFRVAVNKCWNVDPGSVAARVTVEVGFSLARDGKVQGDVRLVASDGDSSATNIAFEAARRAILRCQSGGYQLPADKYDQWKDVVITFDPSGMRLR